MEFMRDKPDGFRDLAVVDPPYGINIVDSKIKANKKYNRKNWDNKIPDSNYFNKLFSISKNQVIWGMNFLNDFLPACNKTIIWDKLNDNTFTSDYELAWTSLPGKQQKIFRYIWYGYFYPKCELPLIHPTQKPVALYKWILQNYAKPGQTIFDSHVGSGSIRIACYDLGFDFVGCELDPDYWQAQEERFQNHISQPEIFDTQEIQEGIFSQENLI